MVNGSSIEQVRKCNCAHHTLVNFSRMPVSTAKGDSKSGKAVNQPFYVVCAHEMAARMHLL